MSGSVPAARRPLRRGLIALLGLAIVALAVLTASRIGTLFPSTAAAATSSPDTAPTTIATAEPLATAPPRTAAPATPEPTPLTVLAPLTGLPISPEAALQRPIAVMVDDDSHARPQFGFSKASIVWHAPAEGGVPRYMMIFQDDIPDGVGPVRSARQYYVEWAAEWTAMFVHHGGSPEALATLSAKGRGQWVYNADGFRWLGRYLWRTDAHASPHNVYTDGEHLRSLARLLDANDGPIEPIWSFAPAPSPRTRPAGAVIRVTYPYETITYRYEAATNRYLRYVDTSKEPQVDGDDGTVVAPTNVVILRMAFGALNDGHPSKRRLEAHNIGKGEAWIATNGVTIKGTWKKASATAPTLLFGSDGKPISLTPGQTFVQVLPLSYGFKMTAGDLDSRR